MVKTEADYDLLMDVIVSKFKPGKLIPHRYLKRILAIQKPKYSDYKNQRDFEKALETANFRYMAAIDKLRWNILITYNMYMRNERSEGYAFVLPEEQTSFAKKSTMKHVYKAINSGKKIMQHVRIDQLSTDEKKRNRDELAKLGQLHHMIKTHK